MIDQIWLKCFESHKDGTEINLHPGVNIIVGDNNHGKSSIIRALDWIVNGRPLGDDFKNGDLTEVVLCLDDVEIGKYRDSKTTYSIGEQDLQATSGTPQEIIDIINMTDINWQFQMDSSFLLSETAGFVSKKLNETVNLQVMDESIKYSKGKVTEHSKDIKKWEFNIELTDEELAGYKDLDAFLECVADLEELDEIVEEVQGQYETLSNAMESYRSITKKIQEAPVYDTTLIDEVEELDKKVGGVGDEIIQLRDMIFDIEHYEQGIADAETKLSSLVVEEKKLMKGKCALCGK